MTRPPYLLLALTTHGAAGAAQPGLKSIGRPGPEDDVTSPVRVLVVGVSDFAELEAVDDISYAERDAELVASTLDRALSPALLDTLTGAEATARAIEQHLRTLLEGATPKDSVIVYLITHGAQIRQTAFLFAQDTNPYGRLEATGVSTRRIRELVESSPAARVLVFADTTHQTLEGGSGLRTGSSASIEPFLNASNFARAGVWVQVSQGAPQGQGECQGHGLYACTLVNALRGAADHDQDGMVVLAELAQAVPGALMVAAPSAAPPITSASPATTLDQSVTEVAVPVASGRASAVRPAWSLPQAIPSVEICLVANGAPVAPDHVFHTGDTLSVSMTVPTAGHLYAINVNPLGHADLLFPMRGEANAVGAGTTAWVVPPESPNPLRMLDPVGLERLFLLWSAEPMYSASAAVEVALRYTGGATVADDEPGPTSRSGTGATAKSIGRPGPELTPVAAITHRSSPCTRYQPAGEAEAWAVELDLDHR